MISIRKYLYAERKQEAVAVAEGEAGETLAVDPGHSSHFSEELHSLSSAILDRVSRFVLTGAANEALRSQLLQVKAALRPDLKPEEASLAAESVSSILAAHQASSQQANVNQVVEAQHIFGLLNQALVTLTEGSDRDLSRLTAIQESLQKTARMRDMAQMRTSLENSVQFIRTEAAAAREAAAQELSKLGAQVTGARDLLGAAARLELAGRSEAVTEIADSLNNLVSGEALYLVGYLCDRLTAVTQRYGQVVADELISRLIKERLKPVMPGNTMYRWTASSLVAVFIRPRNVEKLRKEVADLNRTPLVHKMALSGRTAVLTISPSHLVAEGVSGSSAVLIEQMDRFTLA